MIGRVGNRVALAVVGLIAMLAGGGAALAQVGQPAPGQMNFQGAVTPVMEEITAFHDKVNVIIIAIAVFVLLLLVWVIIRYNARANPTPSKVTHNTLIEVAWTVVPVLILVYIGIFSFKLLFLMILGPKFCQSLQIELETLPWLQHQRSTVVMKGYKLCFIWRFSKQRVI